MNLPVENIYRIKPSECWANGWKGRMKWLKKYIDQKGKCAICKKQFNAQDMTKDHIIPVSKGGSTQWENIQLTCEPCNSKKGNSF